MRCWMLMCAVGCSGSGGGVEEAPRAEAPRAEAPEPAEKPAVSSANDAVLAEIERALPAGWVMAVEPERVTLTRDEPVRVRRENRINAPAGAKAGGGGTETTMVLEFRAEPRWSEAQLAEKRAANQELDRRQAALLDQHGVRALFDDCVKQRRKDCGNPRPRDDEEAKRLAAYQEARSALEASRAQLPSCTTDRRSLFEGRHVGIDDAMTVVEPAEANREAYALLDKVRAVCATP